MEPIIIVSELHFTSLHNKNSGGLMVVVMVALWTAHAQLSWFYLDTPRHMVVANQALHENTKGSEGLGSRLHAPMGYRAFQVACNWAMSCRSSHVIKLKLSSQLIGQFGHMTASARGGGGVTPIDPVLPPATGVKTLVKWSR